MPRAGGQRREPLRGGGDLRRRRAAVGWPFVCPAPSCGAASRPRSSARSPPPAAPRRAGSTAAPGLGPRAAARRGTRSRSPCWNPAAPARAVRPAGCRRTAEQVPTRRWCSWNTGGVPDRPMPLGDVALRGARSLARHLLGADRRAGQARDLGGHRVERRGARRRGRRRTPGGRTPGTAVPGVQSGVYGTGRSLAASCSAGISQPDTVQLRGPGQRERGRRRGHARRDQDDRDRAEQPASPVRLTRSAASPRYATRTQRRPGRARRAARPRSRP